MEICDIGIKTPSIESLMLNFKNSKTDPISLKSNQKIEEDSINLADTPSKPYTLPSNTIETSNSDPLFPEHRLAEQDHLQKNRIH